MGFNSAYTSAVPRRAAAQAGRLMRALTETTRPLIRQHARDHAKRGRVSCSWCSRALRAVRGVELVLSGDSFA